jgi:hypothetical protein
MFSPKLLGAWAQTVLAKNTSAVYKKFSSQALFGVCHEGLNQQKVNVVDVRS